MFSTPFKTTANDWQMDIFGKYIPISIRDFYSNVLFVDGLTFPPVGDPPVRKVINVFQADLCR